MLAPHHAIVELLEAYEPQALPDPGEGAGYQWVELFSTDIGFESKDTIYIAPLSALKDVQVPEGFFCVCVDDLPAGEQAAARPAGALVLGRGRINTLVRMLKNYIIKLQNWEKAMIQYVMEKNLQGLLQETGAIIGNTLLLYNDSFRLLAYYVTDSNDDKYYGDLIKANVSRIDLENDFADLILSLPHPDPPAGKSVDRPESRFVARPESRFVARTVFVQDRPRGQAYMFCKSEAATRGQIMLFEAMMKWIHVFFDREAPLVETSKNIEAFMIDLVENRSTDPMSVSNRADYCGIPADRLYCLFVVRFKSYFRDIEASQLLKKLAKQLPEARLIPYNDSILVINYYKTVASREEADEWVTAIRDILREANAEMGIAVPEESLRTMHLSYKRAVMAIEYGKRIRLKRAIDAGEGVDVNRYQGYDIYAYETYYIYHIIDLIRTENRTILEGSQCMRALAKLYAFDRENKTDNLKLLYGYLINERSASKTASAMHMHRNNVIYRIKRIEHIIKINLDEYHYRFKLLLSYRIIDYYGVDYLKDIDYSTVGTDLSKKIEGYGL
ncbi:MAG: helix-turn-helix domain-containing protein [Clostridiales bacterium]|nr:helix-turn-helix domain-containing protein [Clostridiales bacterium]